MRERLILGPLMILLVLAGLAADDHLARTPFPAWSGLSGNWPAGVLVFIILVVIASLAARELTAILADKGIPASKRINTFGAILALTLCWAAPDTLSALDTLAAVSLSAITVLFLAMVFHARHKTVQGVVAAAGGALLSFVYLGLLLGFLLLIRREHSAWVLLWVVMVTKACDIGAYFAGRALGRHKLIPWLSPGKTWEGLVGGVLLSIVVAWAGLWLLSAASGGRPPVWWAAILPGVALALVGQAGDLFESILKRDAGIKDSGRSIPGFGGVLDVIDSPLLAAPVAFLWLRFFAAGGG
ncbi:MAG: phosphatidate cytidylyltransferase [Phycisphaeraceae bacterium]|nr:phosphatidate cytidylyltransferase [Phycisphaeraceae bacterium]